MKFRDYAYDWIAWAIFAAIPVVIFWQCATSLADQDAASGGPMENAALYPRILAGIMSVLVIIQAVRLCFGAVGQMSPLKASSETVRACGGTVMFIAYLVCLPIIGFHIATPVLCLAMLLLLRTGLVAATCGAILLWLATSFIFEGLLNVVLPVGVFNIALFN